MILYYEGDISNKQHKISQILHYEGISVDKQHKISWILHYEGISAIDNIKYLNITI